MALNRSHVKNGFTKNSENAFHHLPLQPQTVAINTPAVSSRCDNRLRDGFEAVLVIDKQSPQCDHGGLESSGTHCITEETNLIQYLVPVRACVEV